MIKDKLTEAVKTSLENINSGNDRIPLNMRGELEVIVKDRDGNVLSYERDHNQVTNLAKMAIVHLLAGEIGVIDQPIYSDGDNTNVRNLSLETGDYTKRIYQNFDYRNHTSSTNDDGILVSGEQFFFDGTSIVGANTNVLSQVRPINDDDNFASNYPTKMLFGTGMEAYDSDSLSNAYSADSISGNTIYKLNGYGDTTPSLQEFLSKSKDNTNWYSHNAYKCRTLQPATAVALSATPTATDTAISGAIKNCLITKSNDINYWNGGAGMADSSVRGSGYPCFIYARRSTPKFYDTSKGNTEVHYQMNSSLQSSTVPYETEFIYTVVMPAQPVSSGSIQEYYPYNGWILKQAGLFCDSRFKIRSKENDLTSEYREREFISKVNTSVSTSEDVRFYRDSVGGQMLFTRNLSSPILKTRDNEVTFVWHIFVTI